MGTHTHWWGSPKVMGGEFKEENKPEPWELSPYELGREYAYHHRVSGKTAAWIVAYCVALIWAVLEGAVGAPAHRIDAKGNAVTLITHPLVVARTAAILHAGVCVVFHILARRVWSGDDHHDPTKRVGPHLPARYGPLGMIVNSVLAVAFGTVFYCALFCAFNYTSLFHRPIETMQVAAMVSSFGWVPGACLYGFPMTHGWGRSREKTFWNFWEWHRVLFMGCNAPWRPADASWFLAFWLPALGCWVGAMPIPLDWGRAWQPYPITLLYGAIGGMCLGQACAAGWAVAKWRSDDGCVLGFGGETNEREKRTRWIEEVRADEAEMLARVKRNDEYGKRRRKEERERRRREREEEEKED